MSTVPYGAVKQPRACEVPAVRMEAVYKYYGEFTALNEIDLNVERGERIVVCGQSGSGKSTLIRCINLEKMMLIAATTCPA